MSEYGVFAVARSIFDDPDFADEPLTQREAWLWIISEAAFKARRVRGPGGPVDLERGEFCHSVRFMATAWSWSKSRVDRFLDMLENRDMLRDTSRGGAKVYSVCNYNKFQVVGIPGEADHGTACGTEAGHERDKREERKKEEEDTSFGSKDPLEVTAPGVSEPADPPGKPGAPVDREAIAPDPAVAPFYVFEGRTIRLVAKDFELWRKSFHAVDLGAELAGLDGWAGRLKDEGKPWFHAVSGALRKRHNEALQSREARIAAVASASAVGSEPAFEPRVSGDGRI